jgi:hypothetical protein
MHAIDAEQKDVPEFMAIRIAIVGRQSLGEKQRAESQSGDALFHEKLLMEDGLRAGEQYGGSVTGEINFLERLTQVF